MMDDRRFEYHHTTDHHQLDYDKLAREQDSLKQQMLTLQKRIDEIASELKGLDHAALNSEPSPYHWTPECMKRVPHVKWRVLTDGTWYYVESKSASDEQWQGGLSGTQEWLGLTNAECAKAYAKKA